VVASTSRERLTILSEQKLRYCDYTSIVIHENMDYCRKVKLAVKSEMQPFHPIFVFQRNL
jgi:hypothetical protein